MKATRARPNIEVSADGRGIVSHAVLRLPAEVADDLGLTDAVQKRVGPKDRPPEAPEGGASGGLDR